jgi:Nuclease-related domain
MTHLDPPAPATLIAERDLAIHLDAIEGVVSLHDRSIPGSRARIDHISIGPSGVYVIDTNSHRETVERHINRLIVDERDRTDLAIAMSHRVVAVSEALRDLRIPISRALCFVGGDWPTSLPFMLRGVWVGWPAQLYRLVSQPGMLQPRDIETAAGLLDERLPPLG